MVTLVGSRAMKYWFPDARAPQGDYDYISSVPHSISNLRHVDLFVDERLDAWPWDRVATADELYTLKISHSFWELHGTWDKHARDIVFLSRHGAKFLRPLYDILLPIWKDRYPRRRITLDKDAGAFFDDNVVRLYDHDSVHESVAYGERPLYEAILKEGSEVAVDNDKFWALDFDTQIKLVREEIYATALERILIPGNYHGSPGAAYWWALRRTATSLFKGDWALFLLLNLDLLSHPDCAYIERHLSNRHLLRLNGDKNA